LNAIVTTRGSVFTQRSDQNRIQTKSVSSQNIGEHTISNHGDLLRLEIQGLDDASDRSSTRFGGRAGEFNPKLLSHSTDSLPGGIVADQMKVRMALSRLSPVKNGGRQGHIAPWKKRAINIKQQSLDASAKQGFQRKMGQG
jgi:hypothetical protein